MMVWHGTLPQWKWNAFSKPHARARASRITRAIALYLLHFTSLFPPSRAGSRQRANRQAGRETDRQAGHKSDMFLPH